MKPHITEAMVDARVAEQLEAQARRGVSLPIELVRGLARTHLEMTAHNTPVPTLARLPSPVTLEAPAAPPPAPVPAPPPPWPVIPAAVVANRARCQAIIDMTAKGSAEAQAECREAIRLGTSPEDYRATVAARSIFNAMLVQRGR